MNGKKKILLWVSVFVAALVLLSILYSVLSKHYKPDSDVADTQITLKAAPDFTVIDQNGGSVSLSDFSGRPVVVNFWASWCGPCKSEMPDFDDLYKEYTQQGVVFLMVNMTDGSWETVSTATHFADSKGYEFPLYFDTSFSAAKAYKVSSIPYSVFINKDGKIVYSHLGIIDADTIENYLEIIIE